MSDKSKKAFDLPTSSVYVADPIEDLCLIGGTVLDADEAGPLDTEPDPAHPLDRVKRLKTPLTAAFKANVEHRGVDTPIRVTKMPGKDGIEVAVVVAGTSRVRAARAANRARAKRGEPLIKVKCVPQRETNALALLASKASENSARTDDTLMDKIATLKQMLEVGGSEDDAATFFAVTKATIKGWLRFEDNATPAVKTAARAGRIGESVAAELARIDDPKEQDAKLEEMIAAPDKKGRSVKAARSARGAKHADGLAGKREQTTLLSYMRDLDHANHEDTTKAKWSGAEAMLRFVLGEGDPPVWLVNALENAQAQKEAAKNKPKKADK